MPNFARMRDKNESEIVKALERVGASVTKLNGTGVPDLLVGYQLRTFLLEVKNRDGKPGGGAAQPSNGGNGCMSPSQLKWWDGWKGVPPVVVWTVTDALVAIGAQERPDLCGTR
jgi:hypothetical protein